MTLSDLVALFVRTGCVELYAKRLAENDNSKNQVYFGPDFQALNLFPNEGIQPDGRPGNPTFKARLSFGWLQPNGQVADALGAQLILYPQYPEVRFSGFLRGCEHSPSALMATRLAGRVLFLGITPQRRIVGFVAGSTSQVAVDLSNQKTTTAVGVFLHLVLPGAATELQARIKLLSELRRINRLGWIDSKQLNQDGSLRPCLAPQCGGFTLEAELGIPKNSASEPDFLGWEVKQHVVTSFDRPASGAAITLMTPEPTGGFYRQHGPEAFVRMFGYADKRGRLDRMNFGGVHRADTRHAVTGLTLRLYGYDATTGTITNANGAIALVTDSGDVAASWTLAGLLAHWSRKHAKAAYVPSKCRTDPHRQYAYGGKVRLAEGADSLRFLKTFATGMTYYDPGIKLENISASPLLKRRSQFRIGSKNIAELYSKVEVVTV